MHANRRYIGADDVTTLVDDAGGRVFFNNDLNKKSTNYGWDSRELNLMLEDIRNDEVGGRKGMLIMDVCTPLVYSHDGQTSMARAQEVKQVHLSGRDALAERRD